MTPECMKMPQGPFERRRSKISRRQLNESMIAWFWEGCILHQIIWNTAASVQISEFD